MSTVLVGYTGFVGSNLYASGEFDAVYNSKNIEDAYGTNPDLLVYAGLRAEKYLANSNPQGDMELIRQAEKNIEKINPRKLVLISTIDVFANPYGVDECSNVNTDSLQAYGYNRYVFELWVRKSYPDSLIIRLPGLFGKNIKKNFIYDYINYVPFMLKQDKFAELSVKDPELNQYYTLQDNGFYKLNAGEDKRTLLKEKFKILGFSALNFTDSRSVYQFYNLERLWNDINTSLGNNILLWHPATEPVSAAEIYNYLTGDAFSNELGGIPANYDYKTIHAEVFGGLNGYICGKQAVLEDIKRFVNSEDRG